MAGFGLRGGGGRGLMRMIYCSVWGVEEGCNGTLFLFDVHDRYLVSQAVLMDNSEVITGNVGLLYSIC